MIQDYFDMDTKEKIRYVSESSNASTSGYSTMSGQQQGNLSPASSTFSLPPSPSRSPASVLQTEFSNLNLPASNSPQHHQQQQQQQQQVAHTHVQALYTAHHYPGVFALSQQMPYAGSHIYMNYSPHQNQLGDATNMTAALPQHHFGMHPFSQLPQPELNVKKEYVAELRIHEQPVDKFRFRYKSEMHGTHGSLNGANSKRNPKTFPEVELVNFSGQAIIRCSLFQTNMKSPHSHQLVVRKDDADICDPHDMNVSPERGYVAQFQNMGIIHTAKKFIVEELIKKKANRLRFELGREELSTKQMQELQKETEKEAKEMNLNQVCLCFEAFKIDGNVWTRIAPPVFTNSINNRKSAQTGDLRICRLSIATGSVTGGDDLILLVEKVSKKNIKVRFYELNEDEETVWEAFGKFRESDVHHQYAIVCQTPAYKDKDIDKPIEVCIELVRPSDDERSYPPVTFRYKPRDAVASRKRRRTGSTATSSSGSSCNSFELPKTVQEQAAHMAGGMQATQQDHTMHTAMGAWAPTISEEYDKDKEIMKLIGSDPYRSFINSNSEELSKMIPQNLSELDFFEDSQSQPQPPYARLETDGASIDLTMSSRAKPDLGPNNSKPKDYDMELFSNKPKLLRAPFPNLSTVDWSTNSYVSRIFKIYEDERLGGSKELSAAAAEILDIIADHADRNEHGDTIVHEIISNDSLKVGMKVWHVLSQLKLNSVFNQVNANGESGLHCACLLNRPHYIRPLLGLECDPNVQDRYGNTALHVAVKEQHQQCVESFLHVGIARVDLNIRNDEGHTPLHIAIRLNNCELVERLLKYNKDTAYVCSTKEGNNALHMAVLQGNIDLVRLVIEGHNIGDIAAKRNVAGYNAIEVARSLGAKGQRILLLISTLSNDIAYDVQQIKIKEEELSSSSTDDEEDYDKCMKPVKMVIVKQETQCGDDEQVTRSAAFKAKRESINLASILNDERKFKQLIKLLDDADKWIHLAEKSKMQHLLCLWSNAEDMLSYVKKKASSIEYKVFASALADVDSDALRVLQAI